VQDRQIVCCRTSHTFFNSLWAISGPFEQVAGRVAVEAGDAGIVDGENKLVPAVSSKLKNVSDQKLAALRVNALFRREGDQEELGSTLLPPPDPMAWRPATNLSACSLHRITDIPGRIRTPTCITHTSSTPASICREVRVGALDEA
jgi:hypothetical protein